MINIETISNIIYTNAVKTLTKEDYEKLLPQVEKVIDEHKKVRWYFEMQDFEGWKLSSFWRDLKFDVKHLGDFEKIAMVGDKGWQEWLTSFMKPFTSANVKYFELTDKEEAKQWITE